MSTSAPRAVPAPSLDTAPGTDASPVMAMLSDHLPLTLLLDLALGVRSSEVYVAEPPDLTWLSAADAAQAS